MVSFETCKKLSTFFAGIFMKIRDCEGGHHTCRLILCPGIYDTSLIPLSEGSSLPFHVRIETDPVF
jgi:hypothetical protein